MQTFKEQALASLGETIGSSIEPVVTGIRSRHHCLAEAVHHAGLTVTAQEIEKIRSVDSPYLDETRGGRYVRPCTESYVLADGTVWYVVENEMQTLHRFPAVTPASGYTGYYGLAYLVGGTTNMSVEFYAFAFPSTPRGREVLSAIQAGLNRPLAYFHCPR